MAFGFSPKHQQEETIQGLTTEQLIALTIESINALDWKISYTSSTGVIAYTSTSIMTANQEITIKISNNIVYCKSESTGSEMFDMGKNKKNTTSFFSKLKYLQEKITIDDLNIKYNDISTSISTDVNDLLNQPTKSSKDKITDFLSIFTPKEGYFVTPILIKLNLIVFILMLFNGANLIMPENQILIDWGANFKPLTLDGGQWWRLLTCTFLHAGIFHLLFNMYALLYIGLLLEPYLGKLRFIVFYILTGIAASATSLLWHDLTVSVGASGAIFGMYGIFLAMLTTNLIEKTARKAFLTSIGVFVVYNLLNGMKGNIDNAAHIGGLITGLILGYGAYFTIKAFNNQKLKYITTAISSFVIVMIISIVLKQAPQNYAIYDKKIQEFAQLELSAMEFYSKQNNDLNIKLSQIVQGLDKWNRCIAIFDSVDKLDLPIELRVNVSKLREYVNLRIETFNMIRDGIQKDTIDQQLLGIKYNKIDSLINKLQEK